MSRKSEKQMIEAAEAQFQRAYFREQIMDLGTIQEGEDPNEPERWSKVAEAWSQFASFEYQSGLRTGDL